MSCGAATQSRMKSKLPACFAISSASRETTTSSAPRRSASSVLFGDVVKTTVCAPNACANFPPPWPSAPGPGGEAQRVRRLVRRRSKDDRVRPERVRELHPHVAEAPEADDAHLLP